MKPIICTSVRLHNALRLAAVVVPMLAAVVAAAAGHAQPDLGKWY